MKNISTLTYLLAFGVAFGLTSCNHSSSDKVNANVASINQSVPNKSVDKELIELNNARTESGLLGLLVNSTGKVTWSDLDAYYKNIDKLKYSNNVKDNLKQQTIYGLVEGYQLLKVAPEDKKSFYAQELLKQDGYDPSLMFPIMNYFKGKWSDKQMTLAKQKTLDILDATVERNNDALQSFAKPSALTNKAIDNRGKASLEKAKVRLASGNSKFVALREKVVSL